ncbi:MAG: helix-turn-helix domain-containing protein [Bacteroidetes bacterium]|nr:helix-turn-helix domain-containing protein [Bacteroidota bacterium]
MDINEIATKKDIARLENLLHKLLVTKSSIASTDNVPTCMISEKRALEILDVAKSTLHTMKSRGKIPFYKPEGSVKGASYYKISDLEKYMSGLKHKSNDEIEAEADAHILKQKLKREHKVKSK